MGGRGRRIRYSVPKTRLLPTVGIDIRRSQAATITEGDMIVIGAETFNFIGEPIGDTIGLVSACEALKV